MLENQGAHAEILHQIQYQWQRRLATTARALLLLRGPSATPRTLRLLRGRTLKNERAVQRLQK